MVIRKVSSTDGHAEPVQESRCGGGGEALNDRCSIGPAYEPKFPSFRNTAQSHAPPSFKGNPSVNQSLFISSIYLK